MDVKNIILEKLEYIKGLRNTLHENAELGHSEYKTQKIIMNALDELKIEHYPCDRTGVVANLNKGEHSIAIRADIDALPINGVFHGCGHDYHTAIALGCAVILKEINFKKAVKFIFQPAEETDGGALPMIKEGVLKNPEVKYMIGFHVWPGLQVGKIEVPEGPSMGSVDDFKITFKGIGGHAAIPHLCKNPLHPAIDFIQTMNTKSKIENDPLNPHVLTFCSINGGSVTNVIPEKVQVLGTLRTFDKDLVKKIKQDIEITADLSSKKYHCEQITNFITSYPPLINNIELSKKFKKASIDILGEDNVLPLEKTFAAEDFAFFANELPSIHFRIGICDGNKGVNPLHSPNFDASDESLFYGIYAVVNFILSLEKEI